MNHRLLLCALLALTGVSAQAGDGLLAARTRAEAQPRPALVSRETLMTPADVRGVTLSPDGQWIAYRRVTDTGLDLRLRPVQGDGEDRRILGDSDQTRLHWSGDGSRLWLVDGNGIAIFDVGARAGRRIFRFDPARQQAFFGVDPNAPELAMVREKIAVDGTWRYRYLTVDSGGDTRPVFEAAQPLSAILMNPDGEPRYVAGHDGAQFDTVIWKVEQGGIRELMRCPIPERCVPVAWSGDTVWALAHHGRDLSTLQRYRGDTGEWESLHRDPRGISDAVSVLMEADGQDWFAVAYRPDRVEWQGRTEQAHGQIEWLQEELAGANLGIHFSRDGSRWLVQASRTDWQYDRYFLHEPAAETLTPLFEQERQARVPPDQLSDMLPLHWQSPEGVKLHGYAFLPKGVALNQAPIIAMIHGGPYNRSNGEMDVGAQLMANRGYVVFKPNFRASTGYGVKYVTGSGGNFGKDDGALDDIISGLDYLIANGIGNPKKQAVVGHSFGGYASLLAVTHYPERFAFAVPTAAPVDMAWTMNEIAIEGGSALPMDGPTVEVLFPRYGVPYADPAWHQAMHRDSPLAHARTLRTPVYLWAGGKDDRVAVESIVGYVAAANAEQRPVLLIDPDSGHSPTQPLNNEALAWLMEAAAAEHFGGEVTPPSAALSAFLNRHLRGGGGLLGDR